ncbi:speckle-type POZ protein A-like [Trichogramma pretiosum]|uniref:speckle-type POZ protein A-like n=1 Tax=Trichogramma pretiosum TaxID=7493 RepID=UPI0006C95D79|nr:speckle-type POZ protein A-like [Trichogramma pretiosum]
MASDQRIDASTTVTSGNCIYTWTIENYSLIKSKVGEKIESPKFGVGSNVKNYFQLWLYPAGHSEKDAGFISLYLIPLIDSTKRPDKLVCKLTVSLVKDKKVIEKVTGHYDFASNKVFVYGSSKFYELKKIDKLISSQNTVTIHCKLEIFKKFESSLKLDNINMTDQINNKINLDSLFLCEEFSDIRIITSDGNDIPAHKAILAAASPVFRAMFTHNMLENTENSVNITDTTKNTVIEMLRYIYTAEVIINKVDITIELLEVADKYQIDNLKIKCEKILGSKLSSKNAIKILIAAHKYKTKYLEDETIKFITTNTELLSNSEKMKKMHDPDLWVNLTQLIVKSQKNVSCPVCHPENHS